MLHYRVGSWPYPQTLNYAGKPSKDKLSSLLQTIVNYESKKFYNIGPRIAEPFDPIKSHKQDWRWAINSKNICSNT